MCNGRGGLPPTMVVVVISCMCVRRSSGIRWSFVDAFGCNRVGCCGGVLCVFCFLVLVEAFVVASRSKAPIA
jgi:hypothetical protein